MKNKIRITLLLAFVATTVVAMFRYPIEMWCITTGEMSSTGICTDSGNAPKEDDPETTVTIMWCDFDVDLSAPGVTADCAANAVVPVYR